MTEGAQHILRLLEMCADHTAARTHGRQPIFDGILALAGATPVSSGAMGAAGLPCWPERSVWSMHGVQESVEVR